MTFTTGTSGVPIITTSPSQIGVSIAKPLTRTKSSLIRWGTRIGLNPIWFSGGYINTEVFSSASHCNIVWPREPWQSAGNLSHRVLSSVLKDSEQAMETFLGYPIGRWWFEDEVDALFSPKISNYNGGMTPDGRFLPVVTDRGEVVSPGVRGIESVQQASISDGSLVYTDRDNDGYFELAVVRIPAQTFPVAEMKVYVTTDMDPRWEIRDPERLYIDSDTGEYVAEFPSWCLIAPDLHGKYPFGFGEFTGVNVSELDGYLIEVTVGREYNDMTQPCATFIWERTGSYEGKRVDGFFELRDKDGLVAPYPAHYDVDTAKWVVDSLPTDVGGRAPDRVIVRYYAGIENEESDILSVPEHLFEAVFQMTTARLPAATIGCSASQEIYDSLQEYQAVTSPQGNFLAISEEIQRSHFGSRRGEYAAWLIVKDIDRRGEVALFA